MERVTTVLAAQLAALAADGALAALNTTGVIKERDTVEIVEQNGIYWSGPTNAPLGETSEDAEVTWDIWAPSTVVATQIEQRMVELLHQEGQKQYSGVSAFSHFGGSDRLTGEKDVGVGRRIMTTIIRAVRVRASA